MPVGTVAADARAGEIVAVVGAAADRHSDLPPNLFGVAGERFGGQPRFEGYCQPRLAFSDPLGCGGQGDVDVTLHGAVRFGLAGEAGEVRTLDDNGHRAENRLWPGRRARVRGWRRGVLVVGLEEPGPDLVVHLAGVVSGI